MKGNLVESFKIINRISNCGRNFSSTSRTYLLSRQISKTFPIFFVNQVLHFFEKLPHQIKNSNSVKNVRSN